jgi:hypothetical protein
VRSRTSRRGATAPDFTAAAVVVPASVCCLVGTAHPALAQNSKRTKEAPIDLSYLWAAGIGVALVCLIQRLGNRRRAAQRRRQRHRDRLR